MPQQVAVRRLRRGIAAMSVLLVLALLGGTAFVAWTIQRSFPTVEGTLALPGIDSTVTVRRDAYGIPQIYADNPHDLFFAQGFVQAQDRFWQMDVHRHATQGRLAEMFGKRAVSRDAFVRTLGWERIARQELKMLSPRTRSYLQAYSQGVNAYLDRRDGAELSVEYAVLGLRTDYKPQPWDPVDSLTWLKAMAWSLRANMGDEVTRALLAGSLPADRIKQLYPPYPYDRHPPIVRKGRIVDGGYETGGTVGGKAGGTAGSTAGSTASPAPVPHAMTAARGDFAEIAALMQQMPGQSSPGKGSNSWVVSGARTETGEPILANDPHLGPTLPSIWYQMGLHCTTVDESCPFDVAGFTFPGLPGVVIGHNSHIAWGFTNLGADVMDLVLEKVRDGKYLYEGEWRPLRTRTEKIQVAGGEPVTITVRATRHGPLVSDVRDQLRRVGVTAPVPDSATAGGGGGTRYAVALRWTALEPNRTAEAIFALNTAAGWQSFRRAASLFAVPAQNLVYADTEGNIGYQAPGKIPIREHGDGSWPVPGWTGRYDWNGFIDFEALPHVRNPDRGYIVTANNAVVGPDYPRLLTEDWAYGYRSDRIATLIERAGTLSVDDMTRIQMDTYNRNAAVVVPHLLRVNVNGSVARARSLLRGWDYTQPDGSAAAAYFNAVWRHMLALTFHDELPKSAWPAGGGRWFAVMRGLLERPGSRWWDDVDTPTAESRDDILTRALRQADRELKERFGDNPSKWAWGEMHAFTLTHQTFGTSGIGFLEAMFNRGPLKVGGGGSIVNATSWNAAEGYETTTVPSMRMVVSLGDLDASRWVDLTGTSGHIRSPHYIDQALLWHRGRTAAFPFSREAVERATEHTLTLRPQRPRSLFAFTAAKEPAQRVDPRGVSIACDRPRVQRAPFLEVIAAGRTPLRPLGDFRKGFDHVAGGDMR